MTFVVQMPNNKTGHCTVTNITQHIPAKFLNYFIPFRVHKRCKILCFLDEIAKNK